MAINPATGLEDPNYQPITTPPGGLLASAVGTPQAPLPPIDPNTYENDDVVAQMNRITSQDSDYMRLARTAGLQQANKRGLLNSSMAAGATQAEALRAAAPLAGQNAQQAAARNLERVSGFFAGQRQQAQFGHEIGMQARQLSAAEEQQLRDIENQLTMQGRQLTAAEQQQLRDIQNRLQMQGTDIENQRWMQEQQLTAAEQQQMREIATRLQMQGVDVATQRELQMAQLTSAREIAELNITAEMERLGRQLSAAETQQIRDLASREALLNLELENKTGLTRETLAAEMERARLQEEGATDRANLDASTRVQMVELQNLNDNQRAALDFYLRSNQIYAQSLDNLYNNKDIPAPARDQAMQTFLALRNSTANMPALLFGTNLSWPTSGTGTGTAPGAVAPPPAPAPSTGYYTGPSREEIEAMWTDGSPGNAAAAMAAYNAWQSANGGQIMTKPSGSSSGYFDTIGKYSGIGLLGSVL